jgi:hypothetical protein
MLPSQSARRWPISFISLWRRGGARLQGAAAKSLSLTLSWSATRSGVLSIGCLGCLRLLADGGPLGILGSSSRMTLGFGSQGGLGRSGSYGSVSASLSFTTCGGLDLLGGGSNLGGRGICRRPSSVEQRRTSREQFVGIGLALDWLRFERRREGAGWASPGGMLLLLRSLSLLFGVGMGSFVASRARLRGGLYFVYRVIGFLLFLLEGAWLGKGIWGGGGAGNL